MTYTFEDDRQLELDKIKYETLEERDRAEREYYEFKVFKRKLTDVEWEEFWRTEKVKLGYKD